MSQAARSRSRAPVVFLLLTLLALPAFAREQERLQVPGERGFLLSLWQFAAGLVPVVVPVDPGPTPATGGDQETNRSEGDLGPGLDPLG